MLSKLLKYEINATTRIFLPLYAVLMVFALINKAISSLSPGGWKVPVAISMILYVTILIGMFVMTLVVMIQRFYKNLLSDEGYLMFTLPTKTWKHITSKLLTSMMWTVASGIAAVISIFIIAFDKIFTTEAMQAVSEAMGRFFGFLGASTVLFVLELLLIFVISLASNILIIYASIAIGHLFNRHKVLAAMGSFVVLNAVSQILFVIAGAIPGSTNFYGHISSMDEFRSMEPFLHLALWYGIVFLGLLSAGYFAVANYILSKRLNLE